MIKSTGTLRIRVESPTAAVYVSPPGEVSFGRSTATSLKLDENYPDENLSRRVGRFVFVNDRWELHNLSDEHTLLVKLKGGLDAALVPGGWPLQLPSGSVGTVSFQTTVDYELRFAVDPIVGGAAPHPDPNDNVGEKSTEDLARSLGLTSEELRMITAMCEPRLRDQSLPSWTIPSAKQVVDRLSIDSKRAEALVDGIAVKLAHVVDGLIGSNEGRATDRRVRIADFAYRRRLVTPADLPSLD